MLEVRSGALLGSMGDALAAITRVASITMVYYITHIPALRLVHSSTAATRAQWK